MSSKSQHFSSLGGSTSKLYRLTNEDIKKLHTVLLDMYKEIKTVCEKYDIRLIAAGGTSLGAIRHHGFIPWDDDMDIFLFRADYERLKTIFDEELGKDFYLLAPGSKQGANCFLPRIMKKNTTLLGMIDETSPYPNGIYIDINIIEYAPEGDFAFKAKAFWADALRIISYSVYWYQYRSKSFREYMLTSKRANYYRLRMYLGKLCSFSTAENWFALYDRFVQGNASKIFTVPSGSKKYAGERLTLDVVKPLKKVFFEDTDIFVFNNYDWYLSNLYGKYMDIPSIVNREYHLCLCLSFTEEISYTERE